MSARVRTLHADYSPAGRTAVTLDLNPAEDGATADAKPLRALTVTTGDDGEAHAELADLAAGAYRLLGRATLDGRGVEEQATFVLRPEGRELDDVVSRDEVLRQIAAITGGEFRAGTLGTPTTGPRARSAWAACAPSPSGRTRCCCFWQWRCWPPSGCFAAAPDMARPGTA